MTRVLRIYHAGRDAAHRSRERALVAAGVDLTLVVPNTWPDSGSEESLSAEPFPIRELAVERSGDVNRHRFSERQDLARVIAECRPDVIDIHEEPFSLAARQLLQAAGDVPVLMYTAQNLDKRFPPPFAQYERKAFQRVVAMYPCSRQAASVVRGKGFDGHIETLPLGYDSSLYSPGTQSLDDSPVVLGIVGRLVPEKGVTDAVRVLATVRRRRPASLHIIGQGPELAPALALAQSLGVETALTVSPWMDADAMARAYRAMHVLLIPSRATATWVEQFGRVIPEAQSSGAVVAGYSSGAISEVAGPAGTLVTEGAVDQLGAVVRELVTSRSDWQQRRSAGLEFATRFTWESIAERQALLYQTVADRGTRRVGLPHRPHAARTAARVEFGPTATTARNARPMALPVLRNAPRLASELGRVIDLAADCKSLLQGR